MPIQTEVIINGIKMPAPTVGDANKDVRLNTAEDEYEMVSRGSDAIAIVEETGGTRTLSDADNNKAIHINYTGGTHTVTIPDTLVAGFNCTFVNEHASNTVAFAAGGTTTINTAAAGTNLSSQFASCSLLIKAPGTALLFGDLSA